MTYNPSIPAPTDFLSDSQGDIRTNFTAANAAFTRNHVPFPTVTNNGKHDFIELPVKGAIPAPVPGLISGEGTIYTKTSGSESQLFYSPDASGNEYQLTRCITAAIAKFAKNTITGNTTGGWTFLPGGLLLNYGSFNPNTSTTVVFPRAFTGVPFCVQLTQSIDNNSTQRQASVSTATLTASQFVYEGTVSSHINPVYFLAIGI